jgi:hypothetical protein
VDALVTDYRELSQVLDIPLDKIQVKFKFKISSMCCFQAMPLNFVQNYVSISFGTYIRIQCKNKIEKQ